MNLYIHVSTGANWRAGFGLEIAQSKYLNNILLNTEFRDLAGVPFAAWTLTQERCGNAKCLNSQLFSGDTKKTP
jgi:hypothetical protein